MLTIHSVGDPFDADSGNMVSAYRRTADKEGHFIFSFDRSILPENASYILSIDSDILLITGELTPGCLPSGIAAGGFSAGNTIVRDLKIDFPAFLEITFDKVDHLTDDRVRLILGPRVLYESTLEEPDTTILARLLFHAATVDIQYSTFDGNGTNGDYSIADILLLKNDTVKLMIDY